MTLPLETPSWALVLLLVVCAVALVVLFVKAVRMALRPSPAGSPEAVDDLLWRLTPEQAATVRRDAAEFHRDLVTAGLPEHHAAEFAHTYLVQQADKALERGEAS